MMFNTCVRLNATLAKTAWDTLALSSTHLWLAGRYLEIPPQRSWLARLTALGMGGWFKNCWLMGGLRMLVSQPANGNLLVDQDGPWQFVAWQVVDWAGEKEDQGSWWAVMRALGFGLSTVDFAYEETVRWFSPGRPAGSYLVNALTLAQNTIALVFSFHSFHC